MAQIKGLSKRLMLLIQNVCSILISVVFFHL